MSTRIIQRIVDICVIAILVTAPTQFSIEIARKTYISIVDPLIWITCLFMGIQYLQARRLPPLKVPLCTILFLGIAALSILRSPARLPALKDLFQYTEYFVVAFLLLSSAMADATARRRYVALYLAAAAAVVAVGLVHYLQPSVEAFKVRGTFGNRNVLGGFLTLALPVMFGLALFGKGPMLRASLLLTVALGCVVTLSGGTMVGLILAFALMSMLKSQRAFLIVAAVFIVSFAVLAPRLPRHNTEILAQSVSLFDADGQMSTRYPEWQAAAEMAKDNPLTGVGIGSYQTSVREYYGTIPDRAVASEPDSQNLYLVLASTIGLPGLACFVGMLLIFFCKAAGAFVRLPEGFEKGLALGVLGSLVAFAINCIWSPLLVRGIGVPLAAVFSLAMTVGASRDEK